MFSGWKSNISHGGRTNNVRFDDKTVDTIILSEGIRQKTQQVPGERAKWQLNFLKLVVICILWMIRIMDM